MNGTDFEVLTDEELADVIGGADLYKLIGMCGCGGGGGLHDH